MKKSLIFAILALILMAFALPASAVTVKELADSKLEPVKKLEIAILISNGQQAEADSVYNAALAEVVKAEAKKEADKLLAQLDDEFKAKVIGFVKPIPTVSTVLDSISSFFRTNKLNPDQQHTVIDILADRYQLAAGPTSMKPEQRLAVLRNNYNYAQEFRTDVRREIASSPQIREVKVQLDQLGHDFVVVARDYQKLAILDVNYEQLADRLDTLKSNQIGMLQLLADHEARIDTLSTELTTVKTAVEENRFDVQRALSVINERRDDPRQAQARR